MIKYKKEVFIFMVLSVVLFFMNMSYFNKVVLFSENATQIYYTDENNVFNFMTLNSLSFYFISILAFLIVIKLVKLTISRIVLFYVISYFVLFITLSVKKIITTSSIGFILKSIHCTWCLLTCSASLSHHLSL